MNILYGVNATGNGHISRSRTSELKKEVIPYCSFCGRDVKDFFDLENLDHTLLNKASPLF